MKVPSLKEVFELGKVEEQQELEESPFGGGGMEDGETGETEEEC